MSQTTKLQVHLTSIFVLHKTALTVVNTNNQFFAFVKRHLPVEWVSFLGCVDKINLLLLASKRLKL